MSARKSEAPRPNGRGSFAPYTFARAAAQTSRDRKGAVRATAGFTLLEMLVASTIMGVAIVGLMTGLATSTRNAARLRDYDRVVQLARLRMNDILADERIHNTSLGGDFPPELVGGLASGWRANVSRVEEGPSPFDGDFVLDHIQLEVWWMAAGQRRTFALESYRKRMIRGGDK